MIPLDGPYLEFYSQITQILPSKRIFTDPLHTITYGTDASFYRLVPKIVLWVENADEISKILELSSALNLPVVFRAAGTSLSGQAITDSILLVTSRDWNGIYIAKDAKSVRLEPSVIGADANLKLLPLGKKIGPDPASIGAAMIGGIAANNASGMCCGTADNSYKTLKNMKIIFHDGFELDTADEKSKDSFMQTHGSMVQGIKTLAKKVKDTPSLREKIIRKFKIKNTCGYSLNALVDFEDPIQIIEHLMIGSEGTLGFIKDITYSTVAEYSNKASALMIFKNVKDACDAVIVMRTQCKTRQADAQVDAAEIMDRAALRSVEDKEGMPEFLKTLSSEATAVLVETRAKDSKTLDENIDTILEKLHHIEPEMPLHFTKDVAEYTKYWKIRKGLFTAVGAARETGTTCVIEDVAYPIESLAEGTLELQSLFKKYGYDEAIIFGHSLDGNLHFVFNQTFDSQKEIERYESFMDEVSKQVATKYKGSLKAEHGTGRNMAPFVELEWGEDAYALMKAIKHIFDPRNLLNPGVILNNDPKAHLKNFKFMPQTDDLIDTCIECGFCEPQCPSNAITLSPRQRIVSNRHMQALRLEGKEEELLAFEKLYQYDGIETCATCQLCSLTCPVGIDTGSLTKKLRSKQIGKLGHKIAWSIADHYAGVLSMGRFALKTVNGITKIISEEKMDSLAKTFRSLSGDRLPLWSASLPSGTVQKGLPHLYSEDKVVYFSSCINRTMENPKQKEEKNLDEIIIEVLERAGYQVILPENRAALCCGMPFSSKGYKEEGKKKSDELEEALRLASQDGKYPILCDMSPCSKTMQQNFTALKVQDSIEFIEKNLLDRLEFKQIDEPIVIHTTCSTRKTGLAESFEKIAKLCAKEIIIPQDVSCCGFAGDRGFTFPELNKSALRHLKNSIPSNVKYAFSTSKTCEIGLSEESGLDYKSLFYLVEKCTRK